MIDKNTLNALRSEMDKFSDQLKAKYGITVQLGNIKYDRAGRWAKGQLEIVDAKVSENTGLKDLDKIKASQVPNSVLTMHGIKIKIGESFKGADGNTWTLAGFNSRCPKRPLLLTKGTPNPAFISVQKTYKAPISWIK